MERRLSSLHHSPVRVLAHIKKLDDYFGQFLVRVTCKCGAVREITPEALARLVGWSMALEQLAQWLRCSQCGRKAAEVVAVARPRPRGIPKNVAVGTTVNPSPPAQIRTCRLPAYGSYLE